MSVKAVDMNAPSITVVTADGRTLTRKIAELQAMKRSLQHLAEACHGDARPDCPILDDLSGLENAGGETESACCR